MKRGLVGLFIANGLFAQYCGYLTSCIPPSEYAKGSWQVYAGGNFHTGFQYIPGNLDTLRYAKWVFTPDTLAINAVSVGDVNNDGSMEVVLAGDKIYAIRGTDGFLVWTFGVSSNTTPAIGDVDVDGGLEVVFISQGDTLYVLNGSDGSIKWIFYLGSSWYVHSSPSIEDVDFDGYPEVIANYAGGYVYVLRGTDGSVKWYNTTMGGIIASPAVGNVDTDGYPDVIIGDIGGYVTAFKGTNGNVIWIYTSGDRIEGSPVIYDVDRNLQNDVVFGNFSGKVYALNGRYGVYMWSNDTGNAVRHTPAVWDINRDGKREVVAVKGNVLYAIRGTDGSTIWGLNIGDYLPAFTGSPKIANISSSYGFEIVLGLRNGAILTVANNGSVLWRDSLPFNIHNLIVADADGDSCSEIIAAGDQVVLMDSPLNEGGCPTDVYENKGRYTHTIPEGVYNVLGRKVLKPNKGVYFVVERGKKPVKVIKR